MTVSLTEQDPDEMRMLQLVDPNDLVLVYINTLYSYTLAELLSVGRNVSTKGTRLETLAAERIPPPRRNRAGSLKQRPIRILVCNRPRLPNKRAARDLALTSAIWPCAERHQASWY